MRILFLNHNVVRRGGTFYRAYHVARYLVQRGHRVTLLSISNERRWGLEREISEGVEIIHTPDLLWGIGRTGWDPWDTLNRVVYLHGKEWNLIHAWDSRPVVILPALYAREQSDRIGGKLVLDWCDWWGRGGTQAERTNKSLGIIAPLETFFEESFRAKADGSTVISRALEARAIQLGVSRNTIHSLPQGCEVDSEQSEDRLAARTRLGIPAYTQLVGFLGTSTRSDADLLFGAFRVLFRKRPDLLKGVMIGNHRLEIPHDLNQSTQLIQTGFVPENEMRDYITACDVCLAPLGDTIASRARWPSKVNVYLALGRATVTTRVGDLAKILEQEGAGVVTNCNSDDIAEQVCRLLDDVDLRIIYEMKARQLATGRLSWNTIVEQLEEFYRQVVSGSLR